MSGPTSSLPSFRRRALMLAALAAFARRSFAASGDARAAWMARGEAALAAGRAAEAVDAFERAARIDDTDPDAELGQARAWLQDGDAAHARAWSRLVAGEHPAYPVATAWADAIEDLARPAPRRAVESLSPYPALPSPPARRPRALAPGGRVEAVCHGLVDGSGARLRVPPAQRERLDALAAAGVPLWVTDGTGAVLRMDGGDDLSLAIDDPASDAPAARRVPPAQARPAVTGRPLLLLEARVVPGLHDACAVSWPRLRAGLLALPARDRARARIDAAGGAPADGTPVFDACGGWLGWSEAGELAPAIDASTAGACPARSPLDSAALHARWYAALGTVWRAR